MSKEPCMCGTPFTCLADEHWACGFCEDEGCDWCHHLTDREEWPYDKGGVIPPGPTWVRNDTGEDEEVRPA